MVMSGGGERIVFVHARPGDESLITGGTIARLRSDGAQVVVLFGTGAGDRVADTRAALAELDVSDWRALPAASVDDPAADGSGLRSAIDEVLRHTHATALVLGTDDERLREAATLAAHAQRVPVFLSRRVSDAAGQRLTAIDVSNQVDQKLRAVAAYRARWTVRDHTVGPPDNQGTVVTGTEAYVRIDAPRPIDTAARSLARRAGTGVLALLVGVVFGVLGTLAHQATVSLGPVTLPIGLVLAVAAVVALLAGLRLVLRDRLLVLLCAIGLLGSIFLLSLRSPGGSVLVPVGLAGSLWTTLPTLVATIVLAWPKIPARR